MIAAIPLLAATVSLAGTALAVLHHDRARWRARRRYARMRWAAARRRA